MATNTPEHYPLCTIVNRKGRLYEKGNLVIKEYTYTEKIDTGKVDESGNPIYETVEKKGEIMVGEIWLAEENINSIPFMDTQFDFLNSLKSYLDGWKSDANKSRFNPLVVRYNVRNPSEHSEASEVSLSSLSSTIDSLVNDMRNNYFPTEYYPRACVLKPSGKFFDLGESHMIYQVIYNFLNPAGEYWIWDTPSRNELFIYPAKKLIEVIYYNVSQYAKAVGADDWEKLRYVIVYYSTYDFREIRRETADVRRVWEICNSKIRQLSRELKYIYNKEGWKKDLGDKMAGGSLYHPLNAFWETSPKKGLYKSYELQKELYNQKLAGQPKYNPYGAIDF